MDDIDYLASSSAHTYKVYKPGKKKTPVVSAFPGEEIYQHYIEKLDEEYTRSEKIIFRQLADQLAEYVSKVSGIYNTASRKIAFQNIQCAIVTMSINVIGLECLYDLLEEKIKPFITMKLVVNSESVKSISDFVKIIQEGVKEYHDLPDGEIPLCLYGLTADYYNNNFDDKLPLVVIFEDFDCFNPLLLSDILMLVYENLEKMPLLLIFFQSTDILPLNNRLPSKATSNLAVQHFAFQQTERFFSDLIEEICWDPHSSFKLGPKCITHLTQVYKLWDTTLTGAFRRVKYCLFEHFYNKKYAKLCCPSDQLEKVVDNLTDDELASVRSLPSLKKIPLPKDDKAFRSTLKKNLNKFDDYLAGIQHELKVYHRLKQLVFPDETFTFLLNTWVPFLDPEAFADDIYYFGEQFSKLAEYQIIGLMNKLSRLEESNYSDVYKALAEHFSNFLIKIKSEPASLELKENKPHDPQKRTRASNGISSPRKLPSTSRADLAKSLQEQAKQKTSKIKKWREDFLDKLGAALSQIENPARLPYHEIFFFDDVDLLKQFSLPTTRQDVLSALQSPEKILKCKCCSGIGPKTPDLSITYAIYCDNLRVANLKQCFDAFKQLISQPEVTRVSPRKKARKEQPQKLNESQALGRFIKSINTLEYLGLLRAHPRKVDHIERLVWPMTSHHHDNSDGPESDGQMSQISQNLNAITIQDKHSRAKATS